MQMGDLGRGGEADLQMMGLPTGRTWPLRFRGGLWPSFLGCWRVSVVSPQAAQPVSEKLLLHWNPYWLNYLNFLVVGKLLLKFSVP